MSKLSPGQFLRSLLVTTVGLWIFALGVVLNYQSHAGLSPWQVLHFGLTLHSPLSFGQASQAVGAVMVAVAWWSGVRPGLATVMNAVLVGLFTDVMLEMELVPAVDLWPVGYLMLLASLVVTGFGMAVYIRGGLGAGPRDSFMLGMMRITGRGPAPIRITMELGAAIVGLALGGTLGGGTLLYAVGLGPVVGFWFRVLRVPTPKRRLSKREPLGEDPARA